MKKKKIIFVLNDKGGVGKTTVCATLIEYLNARQIPLALFDSDRSNPDIKASYGRIMPCRLALFSEADRFQDSANNIFYAVEDDIPVIVNLPAQVKPALSQWFEDNEILDISDEENVEWYFLHVIDGQYESLNILQQYIELFEGRVNHVLLKNWGRTEDWKFLASHEQLQEYIELYDIPILDFPKCTGIKEMQYIKQNRLTFQEGLLEPSFKMISRRRVQKFLRETSECFQQINYIFENSGEDEQSERKAMA